VFNKKGENEIDFDLCPSAGMILFRFKGYDLSPMGTPKDIGDEGSKFRRKSHTFAKTILYNLFRI
jgi:hypothetical protein